MSLIGNTEAYDFMSRNDYNDLVKQQIKLANPGADDAAIKKMVSDYINGVEVFQDFKPTGVMSKGTTGPWADISRNFAAQTTGDIRFYVGDLDAASSRILWNTEMPAVLERSATTSINGISIDDYRFLYNQLSEQGTDTALDKVCHMTGLVPAKNADPNYLDNVFVYFDETGKIIDIDDANLDFKVDPDTLDLVPKREPELCFIKDAQSRASYKSTSELMSRVNE